MKLHPSGAILGDRLAMGRDFCDRGREAGREGREEGDELAGSGDRGGGKRGSSTPVHPHMTDSLKKKKTIQRNNVRQVTS